MKTFYLVAISIFIIFALIIVILLFYYSSPHSIWNSPLIKNEKQVVSSFYNSIPQNYNIFGNKQGFNSYSSNLLNYSNETIPSILTWKAIVYNTTYEEEFEIPSYLIFTGNYSNQNKPFLMNKKVDLIMCWSFRNYNKTICKSIPYNVQNETIKNNFVYLNLTQNTGVQNNILKNGYSFSYYIIKAMGFVPKSLCVYDIHYNTNQNILMPEKTCFDVS